MRPSSVVCRSVGLCVDLSVTLVSHAKMAESIDMPFKRYNLLSNRFDNRLYRIYIHSTGCQTRLTTGLTTGCIVYTAGCQTDCTTWFDNRLKEQWLLFNTVVKPVVTCTTQFDNRLNKQHCSFNMVVKPGLTVERTVAVRSTRLSNRFDNRLYRVNKHPTSCQMGFTV